MIQTDIAAYCIEADDGQRIHARHTKVSRWLTDKVDTTFTVEGFCDQSCATDLPLEDEAVVEQFLKRHLVEMQT